MWEDHVRNGLSANKNNSNKNTNIKRTQKLVLLKDKIKDKPFLGQTKQNKERKTKKQGYTYERGNGRRLVREKEG